MCATADLGYDDGKIVCSNCGWTLEVDFNGLASTLFQTASLHVTDWPVGDARAQYRVFQRLAPGKIT